MQRIGVWKEAGGDAQELCIGDCDHALLLSLAFAREENLTLDGRTDGGHTVKIGLAQHRVLRHPKPPSWA